MSQSPIRPNLNWIPKGTKKTLGITRDTSADGTKKAFRKIALANHPNKNPNDAEAARRFQKIGEPYGISGDEKKRDKYDTRNENEVDFSATESIVVPLLKYCLSCEICDET